MKLRPVGHSIPPSASSSASSTSGANGDFSIRNDDDHDNHEERCVTKNTTTTSSDGSSRRKEPLRFKHLQSNTNTAVKRTSSDGKPQSIGSAIRKALADRFGRSALTGQPDTPSTTYSETNWEEF